MAPSFGGLKDEGEQTGKSEAFSQPSLDKARSHTRNQLFGKSRDTPIRLGSKSKPSAKLSLEFISLRHLIFDINPKSATPIARILRAELTDREILGLLHGFHSSAAEEAKISKVEATSQFLWEQDEPSKRQTTEHAKLCRLVEDARCKHAIRLRDGDLMDVEIMYVDHPNLVMTFKEDKLSIENAGGEPYHLWPLNSTMTQMGMCVVVERAALEKIYPEGRRHGGIIKITGNTEPAQHEQTEIDPGPEQGSNIFPRLNGTGLLSLASSSPDERVEFVSREMERICSRGRSTSIQGTLKVPRDGPWHLYSTTQRFDQAQPQWPADDIPFARHHKSDDHAWWINDFVRRSKLLREWDEKTWVESVDRPGQFRRVLSERKPEESQAGIDYELVPTLGDCKTYTDDRNYDWHWTNIGEREFKAVARERDEVLEEYRNEVKNAERITGYLRKAKASSKLNPDDLKLQGQVKDMTHNQSAAYHHARTTRDRLIELRKLCDNRDISVYCGLNDDLSPASSSEDISDARQVQIRQQEREQGQECVRKRLANVPAVPARNPKQAIGPAPTPKAMLGYQQPGSDLTAPVQLQCHAPAANMPPRLIIPKQEDCGPFPVYEDPFSGQAATQAEPTGIPEEKQKVTGNAKRSLAHILADTGIQRERHVLQLRPEQTPRTPAQWNCTPAEGQEYNLATADMKFDDLSIGNAVVVDEDATAEDPAA